MRIAALADSALVARRLLPVTALVVAAPAHLASHGRPAHPDDLRPEHCLGYAYRARRGRLALAGPDGGEASVVPAGPSRVTHADALLAVPLDGLGIAELPDFIAADYLADGRPEALPPDWRRAARAPSSRRARGRGRRRSRRWRIFRRTVVPPGGGHLGAGT